MKITWNLLELLEIIYQMSWYQWKYGTNFSSYGAFE